MTTAQALDRDDVIVLVPVSIAWLREESRSQLTSVLLHPSSRRADLRRAIRPATEVQRSPV